MHSQHCWLFSTTLPPPPQLPWTFLARCNVLFAFPRTKAPIYKDKICHFFGPRAPSLAAPKLLAVLGSFSLRQIIKHQLSNGVKTESCGTLPAQHRQLSIAKHQNSIQIGKVGYQIESRAKLITHIK